MRPEAKFVKRMTALFGPPDAASAGDVLHEYLNALAGQSEATLDRAADHIARERRIRAWPTVAECLDAVAWSKRTVNTASMGLEKIDDFDSWWAERLARVSIAKNEKQIAFEVGQVEPYATARWILSSRLTEILAAAEARRSQWRSEAGTSGSETARRITGERD